MVNRQDILPVVDLQRDFIDGALGTREARAVVDKEAALMRAFPGRVIATGDTHGPDHPDTREGRKLPVPHCREGTEGWEIHPKIAAQPEEEPVKKPVFGAAALVIALQEESRRLPIRSITLSGLCTDNCVILNALTLRSFLPETDIIVDASCRAGVSPQSNWTALQAMKACQARMNNE